MVVINLLGHPPVLKLQQHDSDKQCRRLHHGRQIWYLLFSFRLDSWASRHTPYLLLSSMIKRKKWRVSFTWMRKCYIELVPIKKSVIKEMHTVNNSISFQARVKVQFSTKFCLILQTGVLIKQAHAHQIDLISWCKWCLTLNLVIMTLLYLCV